MRVLSRAKTQGELSSDADVESMADFFESTLAGIRMMAKAGQSRQALRNIATIAGTAFRHSASVHGMDRRTKSGSRDRTRERGRRITSDSP